MGAHDAAPETLPLSASPRSRVTVEILVERAGAREAIPAVTVPVGTLVRDLLRGVGLAPEGSAVLEEGTPIPLDTPVERDLRLTVLPTFSGG